jgi:predicted nucleic acid-binding protein
VLIDTSAWVEYLRRTGTPVTLKVRRALRDDIAATTDVVVMEILSGTTDPARLARWERLLARCEFVEQSPRDDAEAAAHIFRRCRAGGETPRAVNDCLVAAIAIRTDIPVLHRDRDFDVIARHTTLQAVSG